MLELWHLHRRAILIVAGMVGGLLGLLLLTGVVVHFAAPAQPSTRQADPATGTAHDPSTAPGSSPPHTTAPAHLANDAAHWDAIPAIRPAVSTPFPAITQAARTDPAAYAQAFASELFTRDYATASRAQLLSWAQAEDAPLRSPRYPAQDWSKVLADSLTDLSWDGATQTPVPAQSIWQVLAHEGARDTVSPVSVRTDPQWETEVARGYQPSDRLTTVQDVTLRVTRQVGPAAGHTTSTSASTSTSTSSSTSSSSSYDVSIAVQLGSSPQGGYGAAATNNYVSQAVA